MSDVSEHDSDSDTETVKKTGHNSDTETVKKTGHDSVKKTQCASETTTINVGANIVENATSSNIVDDLKQQQQEQVVGDDRPEWEKYMQENTDTGAYTYTDPTDGTVYEWDAVQRGWIPKIDDDFIALYQANYGFTAAGVHDPNVNLTPTEEQKKPDEEKKEEKGKKRKLEEENTWFDIDQKTNNNIYVSGLPLSTTEEEFVALMSKYGIIMSDDQNKLKVRMYKTPDGIFKGDARCCYLKHESVVLVCDLLDESDYNGSKIKVEQAVFELKGKYNPALKPKKKKNKKKKEKGQEKLLDWVDRPAKRSKFDRIAILKNMFNYKDFEKDPSLINDLKGDLRSECEKFGEIKKVMVFDRNPEGVASILFHEPEFADKCIEALNGRFYGGRTITAETYDGTTNYQIQETEEELEKRLNAWEKFIEVDDEQKEGKTSTDTVVVVSTVKKNETDSSIETT